MKFRWSIASFAASPLALLLAFAPQQGEPPRKPAVAPAAPAGVAPPRPNLVLVTMDTTRADHLGCYGYERPTTPQLDRLAAESLLFENCQSTVTITTPSHASILTATYPFEHGVADFSHKKSEAEQQSNAFVSVAGLRSVAELLAEQGYATGGFVTAATTKRITGLAAGFAAWSEPDDEVRPGAEAAADAVAWLATAPEPFFLWLHCFDAHEPPRNDVPLDRAELAPDDALRRHMERCGIDATKLGAGKVKPETRQARAEQQIALYDAGLRRIDDGWAKLRAALEARGAWPRTTVVVVGDHGEGLGQHQSFSHGPVWREGTHVPFLLRVPGRAPARVATLVSTIDALPTAFAATAGLPADALLAQARGANVLADDFEARPVFSMSPLRRGEYALNSGRWRFIRRDDGKQFLFDLEADPHELHDLRATKPEVAAGLERQLLESIRLQRARHVELFGAGGVGSHVSDEAAARMLEELEKLGYADGGEDEGGGKDAKKDGDDDGDGDRDR